MVRDRLQRAERLLLLRRLRANPLQRPTDGSYGPVLVRLAWHASGELHTLPFALDPTLPQPLTHGFLCPLIRHLLSLCSPTLLLRRIEHRQ